MRGVLTIIVVIVIAFIIRELFTFDYAVRYDRQIKSSHLSELIIPESKLDYKVEIKSSQKTYSYIRISGYISSSLRERMNKIKADPNKTIIDLYTPRHLIYTGTKATHITLYLKDRSELKELVLNGKHFGHNQNVINMSAIDF